MFEKSTSNSNSPSQDIEWYKSIRFTLTFKALLIFTLAASSLLFVILFVVKNVLVESEKQILEKTGDALAGNIGQIIGSTQTLTLALANVAEKLPHESELNRQILKSLIDVPELKSVVAGGGVWPEEYQFDPAVKRHSFFFAKDSQDQLQFLNDYNQSCISTALGGGLDNG